MRFYGKPTAVDILEAACEDPDSFAEILYPNGDRSVSVSDLKAAMREVSMRIEPGMYAAVTALKYLDKYSQSLVLRYDANVPISATDGKNISYNPGLVAGKAVKDVVERTKYYTSALLGASAHEMGHCFYSITPITGDLAPVASTYNTLEDQKLEDLICEEYPVASRWIKAMVAETFAKDASALDIAANYPVLAARSTASDELKAAAKKGWGYLFNESDADRLEVLAEEYKQHVEYSPEAKKIVDEYDAIIKRHQPETQQQSRCGLEKGGHKHGDDASGKEICKKYGFGPGNDEKEDKPHDHKSASKGEEEQQELPDSIADSIAEAAKKAVKEEMAENMSPPSYNPETGETADEPEPPPSMVDELVRDPRTAYEKATEYYLNGASPEYSEQTRHFEKARRAIAQLMTQKKVSKENRKHGGFSVNSVVRSGMRSKWLDNKHYKQTKHADEGHGSMEVVIGLDLSLSMGSDGVHSMYVAAGHLKHIFGRTGLDTTVLIWGNECHVLYGREEKWSHPKYRYNEDNLGGTSPETCEDIAANIIRTSKKVHKIFINMTDGQWGARSTGSLEDMQKAGAMTSLILYNTSVSEGHGYDLAIPVSTHAEIAEAMIDIVTSCLQKTAAKW